MSESDDLEEAKARCEDRFHNLTARLNAVSHILSMTLAELKKADPSVVDRISATMEESLRAYLGGDNDDFALSRAEDFRGEAYFILKDEASRDRLEEAGLPRPMS